MVRKKGRRRRGAVGTGGAAHLANILKRVAARAGKFIHDTVFNDAHSKVPHSAGLTHETTRAVVSGINYFQEGSSHTNFGCQRWRRLKQKKRGGGDSVEE